MHCIKLQLHINTTQEEVYKQLVTIDGLRKWWTDQTTGSAELDQSIDFRFGDQYFIQMKVINLEKNTLVQWQCIQADEEWIGTIVSFNIEENGGKTLLKFTHDRWPTHGDFFAHCSLSWAKYLLSLRQLLETRKGQPFKQ